MTVDTSVGDVVDLAAVSRWMRRSGLGDGAIENPVMLAGGTQNVLVRFRWCGGAFVLRRPPLRPRPKNNELILREAVVLQALAATTIPHARLLGACDDPDVLGGAVFYVMEAVEGFNPAEVLPSAWRGLEGRDRIVFAATDALADIGGLDHEAIGLADFGKPAGFLERQVDRWVGERERYLTLDGYNGEPLPGYESVRDYLAARVPSTFTPGLMHGDYHFGNLLFDTSSAGLLAVLDWEMATIGDPLTDIGWAELLWTIPGSFTTLPGALSVDEFVARWEELTGIEAKHRPWYRALERLKMATINLVGSHLVDVGESDDLRFVEYSYAIHPLTMLALEELGIHESFPPGPVLPRKERRRELAEARQQ
jgi:aminoglycoside phosphotransferase (APT) family kinase protein